MTTRKDGACSAPVGNVEIGRWPPKIIVMLSLLFMGSSPIFAHPIETPRICQPLFSATASYPPPDHGAFDNPQPSWKAIKHIALPAKLVILA